MLNVTIKGCGVDKPTDDLNYSNLTVTINVNNFDDVRYIIRLINLSPRFRLWGFKTLRL